MKAEWKHTIVLIFASGIIAAIRKSTMTYTLLIKDQLYLTKAEIGMIASDFSVGYGISKLITGMLSDFLSSSIILSLGIFCGSIIYLSLPLNQTLITLHLCFVLLGISLGVGGPAMTKLVVDWYSPTEVGKIWSMITGFGNLGYMLTPFLYLFLSHQLNHSQVDLIITLSGILIAISVIFSFTAVKTSVSPSSSSLSEKMKGTNSQSKVYLLFSKSVWFDCLIRHHSLWYLLTANILTTFCLKGISDWIGLYLTEVRSFSIDQATRIGFWSEVGALVGTIMSGYVASYLKGNNSLTSSIFTALCIPPLVFLHLYESPMIKSIPIAVSLFKIIIYQGISKEIYHSFLLFWIGFGINGPKTLLVVEIQQASPKHISGTVNGISGLLGQLGATLAGYGIGKIIDVYGWHTFLPLLLFLTAILTIILAVSSLTSYRLHDTHQKLE